MDTTETDPPASDFVLTSDDGPDVEFRGWLIGEASSARSNAVRWAELKAYETEGGKIIIERIGRTAVEGEREFREVQVYPNERQMMKALGFTKLTAELYKDMGIDRVTVA